MNPAVRVHFEVKEVRTQIRGANYIDFAGKMLLYSLRVRLSTTAWRHWLSRLDSWVAEKSQVIVCEVPSCCCPTLCLIFTILFSLFYIMFWEKVKCQYLTNISWIYDGRMYFSSSIFCWFWSYGFLSDWISEITENI